MPNLNYDIYTEPKGLGGRRNNNSLAQSICLLNNSGDYIPLGRFVIGDVGERTMQPMDGNGKQPIGYFEAEDNYEGFFDTNGVSALRNLDYGSVYKQGSFDVLAVTPIASGDPVWVVDNPASVDNGKVRNSDDGNAVQITNARFESVTDVPGYVSISINFP